MSNTNQIRKIEPEVVLKGWGSEIIFANDFENGYCGKILTFTKAGYRGSDHFHVSKKEHFICCDGEFNLECTNPINADKFVLNIKKGECVEIPRGQPHRIVCIQPGFIIEASTPDRWDDSFRIEKGDSQK